MSAAGKVAHVARGTPPRVAFAKSRILYWSVRRELWENRSIVAAPLGVAALMLLAFVVGARRLSGVMRAVALLSADRQAELIGKPLRLVAIPVVLTASSVAVFYCLDALHGERRDRSILFWKSLPVSDLMTVLSKAIIPMVVVPAVAVVATMILQLSMLSIASVTLRMVGIDGSGLWAGLPIVGAWGALIHGVVGDALWYAPLYGWLLLVSGWARRSTFLWAVLPPLALCLAEKIAFDTTIAWTVVKDRLFGIGFGVEANAAPLAPASAGLWIGLVVTAVFLAAAVRLRRVRQPI